ncbi:MAG: cyclase family protein [Pseudonocardiaceae bacterium]
MSAGGFGDTDGFVDAAAFDALYRGLKAGWGPDDRRGALNHLGPAQVLAAAREVRSGRTVTLAAPVQTRPAPDAPEPCRHEMLGGVAGQSADTGPDFARDRLTINVHGDVNSHLDALCHVIYNSTLYNGVPAATLTAQGATALSVDVARDGIVGRGVLLDIPRLRGVPWLEPGDAVTGADLAAAEQAQELTVGQGDLLFVRVGHRRRRNELGAWDTARTRAGLHPAALRFVAQRRVALLGCDSNSDIAPSVAEGVGFPVHVLALNAMGLQLLDYLQFEDLLAICEQQRRWAFLCVVAPLRFPAATGSPVNPIGVL